MSKTKSTANAALVFDHGKIVKEAQLVVDARNATKGIDSPKIVRC